MLFCHKKRGFRAALPFDILHTLQLGWMMYIIQGIFNTQILTSKEKKKEELHLKNGSNKKAYYNAKDDDEKKKTSWNVFSDNRKKEFDVLVDIYGSRLQRQSDRNLPRTHFPKGVCADQKRKGHKMSGVILTILIVLLSYNGDAFETKMGSLLFANYVHLMEIILMLEQFLRQRSFKVQHLRLVNAYIPAIFRLYKDTVNRKTGMGDNLIKIHLIRHVIDDIFNLGLPINFDSAPGENWHISAVKIPASKTQHKVQSFHEQIGNRVVEDIAIDRGYYDMEDTFQKFKDLSLQEPITCLLRNQIYRVTKKSIEQKYNKKFCKSKAWEDHLLYTRLMKFFSQKIFPNTNQDAISLYTEYAIKDLILGTTEIY